MSDFDTSTLLDDWDSVLSRAGSLDATTGGVTFSGVWAERQNSFADMNDQLRDEKRFTIFTTATELSVTPVLRQTLVRSGVTYVVESVRADAEGVGLEFDVKRVI
jgi:hypothetical protein